MNIAYTSMALLNHKHFYFDRIHNKAFKLETQASTDVDTLCFSSKSAQSFIQCSCSAAHLICTLLYVSTECSWQAGSQPVLTVMLPQAAITTTGANGWPRTGCPAPRVLQGTDKHFRLNCRDFKTMSELMFRLFL
jgi:hypothetical protein